MVGLYCVCGQLTFDLCVQVKAPEGVEEKYGTHKFYSDDPQPEGEGVVELGAVGIK